MKYRPVSILMLMLLLVCILSIKIVSSESDITSGSIAQNPMFLLYVYSLSEEHTISISLNVSSTFEYRAPPPPDDLSFDFMEIALPSAALQSIKIASEKGIIKQRISEEGDITYRVYADPVVTMTNIGTEWVNTTVKIKIRYVDRAWIPIEGMRAEISVPAPPIPFESENVTLTLEIPAFLPIRFKAIYDPLNRNILSPKVQSSLSPEDIVIEPKRVRIRFESLPFGIYIVEFEESDITPCSILYRNIDLIKHEIAPSHTQIIAIPAPPEGWHFSHAEVIVTTVSLVDIEEGGNVTLEAGLVDEVEKVENTIVVRFIRAKYLLRAYVVYSDRFKIINNLKVPIIVYVVPFVYKEVGTWTPMGLSISVGNNDLEGSTYAFLEVKTYGTPIEKVVIPGNREVTQYYDSLLPWIGNLLVDIGIDHALLQLVNGNTTLSGSFSLALKWSSILFRVMDANGRPLQEGRLILISKGEVVSTSDIVHGEAIVTPYKPALYEVTVVYRGVRVFDGFLTFPLREHYDVITRVYDLKVRVVGKRGQALIGAVVNVTCLDSNITLSDIVDANGSVIFPQLPEGNYLIRATYKGVSTTEQVVLSDNLDLDLKLDVIFDIIGIALKMNQTIIAVSVLAIALITIGILLKRRNNSSSIVLS
ncbi:MAG: hypothetical protein DRZ82_02715 [Thermoprotei archaeon]|nr:MAG: hypothetical protein DRZ82_02715 [Thermoprotei archaeon]